MSIIDHANQFLIRQIKATIILVSLKFCGNLRSRKVR